MRSSPTGSGTTGPSSRTFHRPRAPSVSCGTRSGSTPRTSRGASSKRNPPSSCPATTSGWTATSGSGWATRPRTSPRGWSGSTRCSESSAPRKGKRDGRPSPVGAGDGGALGADLLAKRELERVGIVGVGTQARFQLDAILGVRKPERVIAFGRSEAKASRYAQEMEKRHSIRVLPAKTVEQAVRGSDVVVTVTPSREPLVHAEWVVPGTHITAVGADSPDKQELDVRVLEKADKVVADRLDQCIRLGEIHHAVEAVVVRAPHVYTTHREIP